MKPRKLEAWRTLESTEVVSQRWLRVHEERVSLPNGREIASFHRISSPHWAASLCVTEQAEAVLVRQYRHGIAATSLELPAGVIEPNEAPLAAAQRELQEETGYVAQDWSPLLSVATEPARHTNHAHFFFARGGVVSSAQALDPDEELEVITLPAQELLRCIERGEIVHGVHVAAILWAHQRGLI